MRLPNGYGSITKLSGKRRNPYMVRITIGLDEDTLKPVRKVLGYYPKRADAIAALAKYNEDPYDLSQHAYTFAEVYQMWSAQYFPGVAASTKGTHAAAFKAWAPLHDMAMKDIKLLHYQKALNESEKSPNVKQRMKNLASILSEYAIRHEIIEKDYSRYIEPGGQAEVKRPHQPFTGEEIQTLWDNVGTVAYVDAALILIYTGMRVGELLAMRKENVHLDEKYMIGGSKTAAGKNRIIPLNEKILPLIRTRYQTANDFLIEPAVSYNTFSRQFHLTMKRLGMDHRSHDGRHTFASLMDTAGANEKAIKTIMGHSGGDLTSKVYIHKSLPELLENVNLI